MQMILKRCKKKFTHKNSHNEFERITRQSLYLSSLHVSNIMWCTRYNCRARRR